MGSPPGVLAGVHVLVVDDNRDARTIFTHVLEHHGALVTARHNAESAVQVLRETRVDLVLTDMRLPDRDGTWVLTRARELGVTAPFIAVSGQDYDEAHLRRDGFTTYLRKPVDQGLLVAAVNEVARTRAERRDG